MSDTSILDQRSPPPVASDHELRAWVFGEPDGTVSAVALNLPGVVGCGDTEQEALESLREGFLAVLESCREDGVEIPWGEKSRDTLSEGREVKLFLHA